MRKNHLFFLLLFAMIGMLKQQTIMAMKKEEYRFYNIDLNKAIRKKFNDHKRELKRFGSLIEKALNLKQRKHTQEKVFLRFKKINILNKQRKEIFYAWIQIKKNEFISRILDGHPNYNELKEEIENLTLEDISSPQKLQDLKKKITDNNAVNNVPCGNSICESSKDPDLSLYSWASKMWEIGSGGLHALRLLQYKSINPQTIKILSGISAFTNALALAANFLYHYNNDTLKGKNIGPRALESIKHLLEGILAFRMYQNADLIAETNTKLTPYEQQERKKIILAMIALIIANRGCSVTKTLQFGNYATGILVPIVEYWFYKNHYNA
jgi:hypothetical protein